MTIKEEEIEIFGQHITQLRNLEGAERIKVPTWTRRRPEGGGLLLEVHRGLSRAYLIKPVKGTPLSLI